MSALKYWLWLTELRGLKNQTRLALLRHFGTPENVFFADNGEILLAEVRAWAQRIGVEDRLRGCRSAPCGASERASPPATG